MDGRVMKDPPLLFLPHSLSLSLLYQHSPSSTSHFLQLLSLLVSPHLLTARLQTLVPISIRGEAHDAPSFGTFFFDSLSTIMVTTGIITKTKCFSDQDQICTPTHVMSCHFSPDTPVKLEWCAPMSDIFQTVFTARDLHLWKRKIGSIVSSANDTAGPPTPAQHIMHQHPSRSAPAQTAKISPTSIVVILVVLVTSNSY